jgi:hypothetical protein
LNELYKHFCDNYERAAQRKDDKTEGAVFWKNWGGGYKYEKYLSIILCYYWLFFGIYLIDGVFGYWWYLNDLLAIRLYKYIFLVYFQNLGFPILWLSYYLCTINYRGHTLMPSALSFILNLLFSTPIEFIKIYIGQLPLNLE